MAKTSITIIMYAMYTMASCYNRTNENEVNGTEQVNTTTLYPVNITIEDLKQQETKINHANNILLKQQKTKISNENDIILKQQKRKINNENEIILKEQESKINSENNIILKQEKCKINSENNNMLKQEKSNTNSVNYILKSHQPAENKHNQHGEPITIDKKQEIHHNTDENEEITISDDQLKDDTRSEEEELSDVKSNTEAKDIKHEITTWSLETNYSVMKNEKENVKDLKEDQKKIVKEFRPSPHLGSFYDEDAFMLTTQASVGPWSPAFRKPSSFISSPQDFYKLNYKKPIDAPYKFESNLFQNPQYWKHHTGLESRPTDSVPVRMPAGGLYKSPDILKDRPIIESDEEFGLKFKDEPQESSVKKGVSPWKSFLHLATALLPVGLIISALTPSIITLQSTENNPYYPNRVIRRVENFKNLPQISEGCKRRLLCEIHSGNYTDHQNSSTGHKHCYKVQCDDPEAMMKVLRWVLTHRPLLHHQHLSDDRGRFT